jgi:hypothetical protein
VRGKLLAVNPALPLLLLACLLPWLVRRSEATVAWALIGLVATALLLPALAIPDGIVSPSATLSKVAPWQGTGEAPPPGGAMDDVTFQVEPWLLFLRHELRAGRLPFWNPYQSSGTPFWANGSSAPLFPLHLLFALLPVQLGLVLLPWLRLVIAGLGAWWLARELGVDERPALLAGVIYPLSGRVVAFLLYPMANAFCLVPWILLMTERLASDPTVEGAVRRRAWRALALLTGLQLLAGHPETAVLTALLATVYLLVRVPWRRSRLAAAWGPFVAAWAVGGALSAVQTLPLASYLLSSTRWAAWHAGDPMPLALVARLALRFVLPDAWGHPATGDFWGPFNFVSTTLYLGALTLPLALAAVVLERRDRRFLAVAAMSLFALLGAFRLPPVEPLLMALPVVQKALHHYLAFGFSLGLALLAAAGLARWRRGVNGGAAAGVLAGAILTLAALGSGWLVWSAEWSARGQLARQATATAITGGLVLLLAASLKLPASARRRLAPLVVTLAALDLWAAHDRVNPALPVARLYPVTPAIERLAAPAPERAYRVAATGFDLRPNAGMVYRFFDVRGDDSLKLAPYERLYGSELGKPHPTFFRPLTGWQSPWLDRLGVRWVLTPPGASPPVAGWRLAYDGAEARLYERPTAWPLVRWLGADSGNRLEVALRRPGRWEIEWEAPRPAVLILAECWEPGWYARVVSPTGDARPVAIERLDGVLMAITLGPGEGRLVVRYRPPGLVAGVVAGLLGLLALWLGGRRFGQ